MALSGSVLGSLIDSNLTSAGAVGSNRTIFCNALGNGIVNHIVGSSFTTTDTGTTPGSGTGTGTGIVGLTSSNMVSVAIATMSSTGVNANPLMQAIMDAVVTHLNDASLSSTHAPVVIGAGIVDIGSISVTSGGMKSTILTEFSSVGATGSNADNLAEAIATGIVTEILAAGTGNVTIVGSPPPTPVAGVGTGIGVIS